MGIKERAIRRLAQQQARLFGSAQVGLSFMREARHLIQVQSCEALVGILRAAPIVSDQGRVVVDFGMPAFDKSVTRPKIDASDASLLMRSIN